jgi:hypothetical protein
LQQAPAAAFAGIACAVLSCILITAITFNVILHRIFDFLFFALFPSLVRKKRAS